MLILARYAGQGIEIGQNITQEGETIVVKVVGAKRNGIDIDLTGVQIVLGIEAPRIFQVFRDEVADRIRNPHVEGCRCKFCLTQVRKARELNEVKEAVIAEIQRPILKK